VRKRTRDRSRVDLETGEGLIIERESLLSPFRKAGQYGWGAASWLVMINLLRPVLAGLLWIAGEEWARRTVFSKEGLRNPDFFIRYSLVILGIFLVFLGWNRYNFLRFRGPDRRQPRGECESYELARYYDIGMEDMEALAGADVEISFEPDERIVIETDSRRTITAMYAPLRPQAHLARLKARDEAAKVYVEQK
jgi:biofilm PGA synthesis protein PgaD